MKCNFIVYTKDQEASMNFYRAVLGINPTLHVEGMTEFQLREGCVIGLMPEKGIKRLLGTTIQDPEKSNGVSRCEIYLSVNDPALYLSRAETAGAKVLSPLHPRNWGDEAGYVMDPDGHVLVFARTLSRTAVNP